MKNNNIKGFVKAITDNLVYNFATFLVILIFIFLIVAIGICIVLGVCPSAEAVSVNSALNIGGVEQISPMTLYQEGVYIFYDKEKDKEYLIFYATNGESTNMEVMIR